MSLTNCTSISLRELSIRNNFWYISKITFSPISIIFISCRTTSSNHLKVFRFWTRRIIWNYSDPYNCYPNCSRIIVRLYARSDIFQRLPWVVHRFFLISVLLSMVNKHSRLLPVVFAYPSAISESRSPNPESTFSSSIQHILQHRFTHFTEQIKLAETKFICSQ